MSTRARRISALAAAAALLLASAACGDDDTGGGASNNANNSAADVGTNNSAADVGTNNGDNNSAEDVAEEVAQDVPVEEDTPPDVPVEDAAPDVVEDVYEPARCTMPAECQGPTACIDGICTYSPAELAFVEDDFIVREPEELTAILSVLKSFLFNTAFFLTDFAPLDVDNTMLVTYGGADRIQQVPQGLDVYSWQFPVEELPTFRVSRYLDPVNPDQDNTWESEVFDYRLVAIFEFNNIRSTIGFEAKNTTMTATFNADLTQILEGRLDGYITRQEAESRLLNLQDPDCFFTPGICPDFECGVDPPLMTLADVLDCNGAPIDADVDPDIEGHDAYHTVIIFQSRQIELQ